MLPEALISQLFLAKRYHRGLTFVHEGQGGGEEQESGKSKLSWLLFLSGAAATFFFFYFYCPSPRQGDIWEFSPGEKGEIKRASSSSLLLPRVGNIVTPVTAPYFDRSNLECMRRRPPSLSTAACCRLPYYDNE